MFARHVIATVVALSWKRTVVIEQGRWRSRRTAWKPRGDSIRNLRRVRSTELDAVFDGYNPEEGGPMRDQARMTRTSHTNFEYEELEWRRHRSLSESGDGPGGVRWPEPALEDGQRVSERREAYRATFSAGAEEYRTELSEATWRRLRVGMRYRLKLGTLSGEVKEVTPLRGSWR